MSDVSVSLSSSDEEVIPIPRVRIYRQRNNPMDTLDDGQFKARYRVSKAVMFHLTELLGDIGPLTRRSHALSAVEQVMLAVHFFASGSFQITVADNIRVHKSTACAVIRKVARRIALLRPRFIQMPGTATERAVQRNGFFAIAGFPKTIGAVDCTHIKIQSPGGQMSEMYRNRKGYFSLNTPAVCNARLEISDIVCRWPGSVHDTTIFNDCPLRADFETGVYGHDVLVGDSGYPCRKYLLTPFAQPANPSEEAYNRAQIATRNPIERCFGVLKKIFPCLSMGLRVKIETAMQIVVAYAVLHNICINQNDRIELELDLPDDNASDNVSAHIIAHPHRNEQFSVRNALLESYFNQ